MGIYDLPAIIDYILDETEQPSLSYYGYSMGTTMSYVLLSMLPEYNKKIDLLLSAAPVVFWKHELKKAMKFTDAIFPPLQVRDYHIDKLLLIGWISWRHVKISYLQYFMDYFHVHEVIPQTALAAFIGTHFCGAKSVAQPLCVACFANIGLDSARFNEVNE